MFDPSKKRFSKNSLRLVVLFLFCVVSIAYLLIPRAAQVQTVEDEPIAYVGHGAMFDKHGTELAPTIRFIRQAQEWYMADLLKRVGKKQQTQFSSLKQEMTTNLAVDEQSQLVLNSSLMDWLIDRAEIKDRERLRGKNNLLKKYLKRKLSDNPDIRTPRSSEKFQVDQKLLDRIKNSPQLKISKNEPVRERKLPVFDAVWLDTERKPAAGLFWNAAFTGSPQPDPAAANTLPTITTNGGLNYRNECTAAGVPVPPDFGPTSLWVDKGFIPRNELFIEAGNGAMVRVYSSSSPAGMCIALPRFFLEGEDDSPGSGADFSDNEVDLDGVICLGQTGNVCFWDNEKNGVPVPAFDLVSNVAFSDFGGGAELRATAGGVCSDCHAGENPYIIHGTVLESLDDGASALPTFAPSWHNPIVRNGDTSPWPENPGPMNSPASCVGCHGTAAAGSFAGRLPHLSPAVSGYCGSVLRAAVGTRSFASRGPLPTMPQGDPGGMGMHPESTGRQPKL